MQSSHDAKLSVVDEIQHGSRSCRAVVLANGMRVVMISDPTSTLSSASMSVRVGSFMDPEDLPGLAHLLEHVLFLGTEKYPNNGEFRTFLAERGGATNADTSSTVTTFHFYVGNEHAQEALARFSEFFKSPLLSPDNVVGEVEIVHSEFESMLYSDAHRQLQVMRSTSSKDNPFSRILIGTRDTLLRGQSTLHSQLKEFFEQHYSANLMSLAVLSSQPLDVIESWILQCFSAVPDYQLPFYIPLPNKAFDSTSCIKKLHRIRSVQGYRNLSFMFEIKHDELSNCRINANDVIACLMRNQDRFQYLEKLRAKGLATNYSIVPFEGTSYLQLIVILTELGVSKIHDVILLTFRYLSTVRSSPQFEIRAAFDEVSHEYPSLADSHSEQLCQHLSNAMSEMGQLERNLLGCPVLSDAFTKRVINALGQLYPDNCRLDLLYPWEDAHERQQNVLVEQFYGTEYSVEPLPDSLSEKIQRCSKISSKKMFWSLRPTSRKLNKTIASRFRRLNCFQAPNKYMTLNPRKSISFQTLDHHPNLLVDTSMIDLWHYRQNRSSAFISAMFQPNAINAISDCQTLILGRLFVKVANVLLSESLQGPATEAGYKIILSTEAFPGFVVHCSGNGEKIRLLITTVVKILRLSQSPKKSVFKKAFDALMREIREQGVTSMAEMAERQLLEHLLGNAPSKHEAEASLQNVDLDNLKKFATDIFHTGHWTILATGGIFSEAAIEIGSLFTDLTVVGRTLEPPGLPTLSQHTTSVVTNLSNNLDRNSAIATYFLLADSCESVHSKAIAHVLIHFLKAPIFEQLRTKEKLGYNIWSQSQIMQDTIGLSITVQSERFSPQHIVQRIDNAFAEIGSSLRDMSPETEASIRIAAAGSLRTEAHHETIWDSIRNRHPVQQQEEILQCILQVTKDELVQLFRKRLHPDSKDRLQVTSMIYGHEHQKELRFKGAFSAVDVSLRQSTDLDQIASAA